MSNKQNRDLRKTILRNPEVPFTAGCTKSHQRYQDQVKSKEEFEYEERMQKIESSRYHAPKANKMKELDGKLEKIKLYQADMDNIRDMTPNSKTVASREVIIVWFF
jgi:hypothetical protein